MSSSAHINGGGIIIEELATSKMRFQSLDILYRILGFLERFLDFTQDFGILRRISKFQVRFQDFNISSKISIFHVDFSE